MRVGVRSSLWVLMLAVALSATSSAQTPEIVWLGADRQPLRFQSDDEILDFLRTAREVSSEPLPTGITKPRRLRLARNGVQAHAIFHHVDRSEQKVTRLPNGNVVMYLRDSYRSQIAAFELSRILGMSNVPPTVLRVSGGLSGSAQLWIEDAITEDSRQRRGLEPPNQTLWNQVYADMRVFDNLINNIDRNQGNMLVDSGGNLWLIDHTRSFGRDRSLPLPETLTRCSRRLWKAVQELDESEVQLRLGQFLGPAEMRALFSRREKLVDEIERQIAERGERRVLFDYGDLEPGVEIRYESAFKGSGSADGSARLAR